MSRITFNNRASVPPTPAAGKSSLYVLTADNMVKLVDSAGIITALNNHQISSTVAASAAIANSDTKIGSGLLISANTITAGSKIRYSIKGTNTSSAAGTQVFNIRFGAANTVADASIGTVTIVSQTSGTGITFDLVIEFTVRTIGASGTIYGYGTIINQGTTGFYTLATGQILIGNLASINTTVSGYIGLSYVSGHASCATTFQNVITELIRQ